MISLEELERLMRAIESKTNRGQIMFRLSDDNLWYVMAEDNTSGEFHFITTTGASTHVDAVISLANKLNIK